MKRYVLTHAASQMQQHLLSEQMARQQMHDAVQTSYRNQLLCPHWLWCAAAV
jgi:hypothetical protein